VIIWPSLRRVAGKQEGDVGAGDPVTNAQVVTSMCLHDRRARCFVRMARETVPWSHPALLLTKACSTLESNRREVFLATGDGEQRGGRPLDGAVAIELFHCHCRLSRLRPGDLAKDRRQCSGHVEAPQDTRGAGRTPVPRTAVAAGCSPRRPVGVKCGSGVRSHRTGDARTAAGLEALTHSNRQRFAPHEAR
jgi:hypothetical protein